MHRQTARALDRSNTIRSMQHIAEKYPDGRVTGTFTLGPVQGVFGDLRLKGPQTSLELRHHERFTAHDLPDDCITGTLHDLSKVTLLNCLTTSHGTAFRNHEEHQRASVSPQVVVFGDTHIQPKDAVIRSLMFVIDDADVLFHDHQAFGTLIDARAHIEQIVKAARPGRVIPTGPHPRILYFTGKTEIVTADTCLGTVSVTHNPSWGPGSPRGVRIDNRIVVTLNFAAPATFEHATTTVYPLLRFFEVMIGRPQNIQALWLRLPDLDGGRPDILDVYLADPPSRETRHERRRPHFRDVLLSPVDEAEKFAGVMTLWLAHDRDRRMARVRFSQAFGQQHYYPIDRMIAAANMFDLLPQEAAPAPAKTGAKARRTPLKQKILRRAKPIIAALGHRLPELELVIQQAVECRNYFVHGPPAPFDVTEHFGVVFFLNDTLEFVFAASELIDGGWDIAAWAARHSSLSHPFAAYCHNYAPNLAELRALLGAPKL